MNCGMNESRVVAWQGTGAGALQMECALRCRVNMIILLVFLAIESGGRTATLCANIYARLRLEMREARIDAMVIEEN